MIERNQNDGPMLQTDRMETLNTGLCGVDDWECRVGAHYIVSAGPMIVTSQAKMLESSTRPAEK